MMLYYQDGNLFATSYAFYQDSIEGRLSPKICVAVQFGELAKTVAVVDTAAPYCVLSREEVEAVDPTYKDSATEETSLHMIEGEPSGVLIRWPITLIAEDGPNLTIDGTIFVPDDHTPRPTFIGLDGILNRMRFAVEPQKNLFYFGGEVD